MPRQGAPAAPNSPGDSDWVPDGPEARSPASPERQAVNGNNQPVIYDEETMSTTLPPLHLSSYHGDLAGVLACITDGHRVDEVVTMRNQAGRLVCGITPLFLAAQRGHYKLAKLLVTSGANPAQPAYISGSVDLCTPVQVARLNLHLKVAYYLSKAASTRKQEDKVLKDEEKDLEQRYNNTAVADATPGAQHAVMANLGDLSGWDPSTGNQPALQSGNFIARMLKTKNIDLTKWRPDRERTKDGEEQMMTSQNRVVDPNELVTIEAETHTAALTQFLQDADLYQWNPEESSMRAGAPSSIAGTRQASSEIGGGLFGRSANTSRATSPAPTREYIAGTAARPNGTSVSTAVPTPVVPAAAVAAGGALPLSAAKARSKAVASSRWYAHGGSDSDEEDDLEASASVPAAPPTANVIKA